MLRIRLSTKLRKSDLPPELKLPERKPFSFRSGWSEAMSESEQHDQTQGSHIVCINNNLDLLEMICLLLEDEGYQATPLTLEPDTHANIVALEPDAIIIDLTYQNPASWNLLEQVNADPSTGEIPRIVVSTDLRALETAQTEAERYGGDRFLLKPFDVYELTDMIRDLLDPDAGRQHLP
jgi:CheY-like chemotaxis protein